MSSFPVKSLVLLIFQPDNEIDFFKIDMISMCYIDRRFFQVRTRTGANILHFALFADESENNMELFKMIKWITNIERKKSPNETSELVKQSTMDGDIPLAFAVCRSDVTEELVKLLVDVEYEKLLFVLNALAKSQRLYGSEEEVQNYNFLIPLVKQLEVMH